MKRGETRYVDAYKVSLLKPHKDNEYLYQDQPDDDLLDSIRRSGIRTPLVVDAKTKTVISGHRRLAAAKEIGLKTVPVVMHYGLYEDQILMMLVDLNKQRVRTNEMIMREAALIKSAEMKRRGRLKKEARSKGEQIPSFEGTALEVAAGKTGLSPRQVGRAVAVTNEIDHAVEEGDEERVQELKKAAEKSIASAEKVATESKAPKRKKATAKRVDPYTVDRKKMAGHFKSILKKIGEIEKETAELTETSGGEGHYSRQVEVFRKKMENQYLKWRGDLK